MKKRNVRLFGIIALVTVIVFLMAACIIEPDEENSESNPVALTNGVWAKGTLAKSSSEYWYSFNVTSGNTYYLWVRDYLTYSVSFGDGFADVLLSAKYQNGAIFTGSDSGANNSTAGTSSRPASNFTATQTGTVLVKVHLDLILLPKPGKYWVAFTTTPTRPSESSSNVSGSESHPIPLTNGVWIKNGTLALSSSAQWYSFNVTSGATYYLWVRDYWTDSASKTDGFADVLLSAKYQDGTAIFEGSDSGYQNSTTNSMRASNFTAT
jgi:hypothetical protein